VTAGRLLEEGSGRVERLVLLDTVAYRQRLPFYVAVLRVPLIGSLTMSLIPPRKAVEMVLDKTFHDDRKIPEDATDEYARALGEPGGRHALIQTARLLTKDIDRLTDSYSRLDVPTMIVWGRDDEIVPLRVGRRLQQELPDAGLRIIPECGHAPQEECPERVLPLIEAFLE
jgi:pimeloyl-ACP methyl ester carboxylesterase